MQSPATAAQQDPLLLRVARGEGTCVEVLCVHCVRVWC